MALPTTTLKVPTTTLDFNKIFSLSSPRTPYTWPDSDYLKGWHIVGSTPPAREQFDALQRFTDERFKFLKAALDYYDAYQAYLHQCDIYLDGEVTAAKNLAQVAKNAADSAKSAADAAQSSADSAQSAADGATDIAAVKKTVPGYLKFKNGVIIQMGEVSTGSSWVTVNLPISYKNFYVCAGTDKAHYNNNAGHCIAIDSSSSLSSIKVAAFSTAVNNAMTAGVNAGWFAIGY